MKQTVSQQDLQRRRAELRKIEAAGMWDELRARSERKARQAAVEELHYEGERRAAAARNAAAIGTPEHTRKLQIVREAMAQTADNPEGYALFQGVYNRMMGRQAGGRYEQATQSGRIQRGTVR